MFDYDLVVIGSGPGGQKAAISRRQARPEDRDRRAWLDARRRLRQHRHHPLQNPPRSSPLPDRNGPARPVRRQLPGEVRHHHRRPDGPHPTRRRPRGGGGPRPAPAQPRRAPPRHRELRRRQHDPRHRQRPRRVQHHHRREGGHRHRHPPGAPTRDRVRRPLRPRLRRDPQIGEGPHLDGGGRQPA